MTTPPAPIGDAAVYAAALPVMLVISLIVAVGLALVIVGILSLRRQYRGR